MTRDPSPLAGRGWNPVLAETLNKLVYSGVLDPQQLDRKLEKLGAEYSDTAYSELIYLLTHLRFDAAEAKDHWQKLLAHHHDMGRRLASSVDLRVALVSYFLEIAKKLENPTVIELRLLERAEALAYWDELTGLRNYRFFCECLAQEILRGEKFRSPLSLVMIDVDEFKLYNDKQGHAAGNEALAQIGRLIADSIRQVDIAARYGGEEFAIICPRTGKTGARMVAERARIAIEEHFSSQQALQELTVSMGVATCPADAEEDAELIRCADRALYTAKESGRNQVQLFGQSKRSYKRVEAVLEGTLRSVPPNFFPLTTIDLGDGGVRFRTPADLEMGQLVDAQLQIPGAPRQVAMVGRVVQVVSEDPDSVREAAIEIIDMNSADYRILSLYLRSLAD